MSLLNSLQSQVEKITEEENRKNAELLEQEAFYDNHLKHVMVRVHNYFQEIIKNLNIVAPDIYPSYPLNPIERNGVTLKQADYAYNYDNARHPRQIDIVTVCDLKRPIEFYVPTADAALNHSNLLESYQFPHHRKNKLDKLYNICGATFILEGPMQAQIRLSSNPAEKCIDVFLWNMENQPFKKHRFSPDKVDDQLLERLARLLIREESTLVTVKVYEGIRGELQRKIEKDKRLKEEDLAKAHAQIQAERLEVENAKLVSRAKRAIVKGNQALLKIILKVKVQLKSLYRG